MQGTYAELATAGWFAPGDMDAHGVDVPEAVMRAVSEDADGWGGPRPTGWTGPTVDGELWLHYADGSAVVMWDTVEPHDVWGTAAWGYWRVAPDGEGVDGVTACGACGVMGLPVVDGVADDVCGPCDAAGAEPHMW